MGTKSPSCLPSAGVETVRITTSPLSLEAAVAEIAGPDAGAVLTFSVNVRDTEKGAQIRAIRYEAYESMAKKEMRQLVAEAARRFEVRAAVHHRVGEVPVGESSLIIATAGCHRPETYEANRFILEEIKTHVPIWKVGFLRGGEGSE